MTTPSDNVLRFPARRAAPFVCLACGDELAAPLARAGALRCFDCHGHRAPLQAELVEPARPRPLAAAA
jgi:hypothetical protein